MILDALRLVLLLGAANSAPPLAALLLQGRCPWPVDLGLTLTDGRRLFGTHKTWRGLVAGTLAGGLAGVVLGFGAGTGLVAGALALVGDLLSSFLKRRLGRASGQDVPGLDQFFEAALPLALLHAQGIVSGAAALWGLGLFCSLAWALSQLYKGMVLDRSPAGYPARTGAGNRFREYVSCRLTSPLALHVFNFKEAVIYNRLYPLGFRLLGLEDQGRRTALRLSATEVVFGFADLPPAFDGYRLLLLTDLHLDGLPGLTTAIVELVARLPVDLCLLGGDYRFGLAGPIEPSMVEMARLLRHLRAADGTVAVLGNHDCPEMAEILRELGATVLANQSLCLRRRGAAGDEQHLWIAGVDDPRRYKAARPDVALAAMPAGEFAVLLAHAPEAYAEAAWAGARLYLCGHTHAGQVRLAGLGALSMHSSAPRALTEGVWQWQDMRGYTSSGAGVSGAAVRIGTRGEVAVITLRRAPRRATGPTGNDS